MITKGYTVRCDKCGSTQFVAEAEIGTPELFVDVMRLLSEKCERWEFGLQPDKHLVVDLCPGCSAEYNRVIRNMFPITPQEPKKKAKKVLEVPE